MSRENGVREDGTVDNDVVLVQTMGANHAIGESQEDIENPQAVLMRRLKGVVKVMEGYDAGPLVRSSFTDLYSFELKTPTGNICRVSNPLDFAEAVTTEYEMELMDNSTEARDAAIHAKFHAENGRLPNIDEVISLRNTDYASI